MMKKILHICKQVCLNCSESLWFFPVFLVLLTIYLPQIGFMFSHHSFGKMILENINDLQFLLSVLTLMVGIFQFGRYISLLYHRGENTENYKVMLKKEQDKNRAYKDLNQAKYEIEDMSHRLMYLMMLMEKSPDNETVFEELRKFKIKLKNYDYFIHTGNDIFDFMICAKIKDLFSSADDFKSMISISKNEAYNQVEFIDMVEEVLTLFSNKENVEMALHEKSGFTVLDLSTSSQVDFYNCRMMLKEKYSLLKLQTSQYQNGAMRHHLKIVLNIMTSR